MIFGAAAVIAAYLTRPSYMPRDLALRASIFWIAATPILFLLPSPLAALIACGIALFPLTPKGREDRAAFYLMTLIAVPSALSAPVPFPGLNYLISLDFAKIACATLLLPALAFTRRSTASRYAPKPGLFVLLLTLLYSVQEFRSANLTSGLRNTVDNFLLYLAPFAALVRLIPNRDQFDRILASFGYIAAIFFFAALISEVFQWNFYTYIGQRLGLAGLDAFADFRHGFLRIKVTVVPALAGYMLTLGLLATEYFRAQRMTGFLMTWIYRGAFALATFFTYSRGAWLAMAAALATFYFFTRAPRAIRAPTIALALFAGLPVAIYVAMTADFSSVDEYGTFEYRRELIRASMVQISQHPIFGDPYFLNSGNFDRLYQGQGIIDIVNHYIQIALEHGLAGLALYLGAFAAAISGLLSLGKDIKAKDARKIELQRAVLLAAAASYLILIATTSAVSLISHFGVLILALSAAFVGAARAELKASAKGGGDGAPDAKGAWA